MKIFNLYSAARRVGLLALAVVMVLALAVPAYAAEAKTPFREITATHRDAEFTYELFLTDSSGMSVENPRNLSAGDTLYAEIRLNREQFNGPSYDSYGIEFRLLTRGLTYNYDGRTLRSGTDVREMHYSDGDSVGFAWYDMQQVGESTNNPVLAGSWSYTVADPNMVNITVPVALIYVTGETEEYVPVGKATLYLDPNGGKLLGEDVSGTYTSGTAVTLPGVEMGDWIFAGWSDGARLYPAGSRYVVSGIVTLTAQWEELDRNRHLTLDPNGGEIVGEDVTGYYADGETVMLPGAQREGFKFLGWDDGTNVYGANEEYTVTNTVILVARWEAGAEDAEGTEPIGPDKPGEGGGISPWGGILTALLAALIGWLWWLLLLWKRKTVKYSLITGDVSLDFKNGDEPVEVSVVLYDGEKEYHLNKSGTVEVKHRLKFIKNVSSIPVAAIEPGTYQGKLLIHEGNKIRVRKCRIKALDKELDEK